MPANEAPFRFRNGQWEVLGADDAAWAPVDADLARLLAPYTSVEVQSDGSLAFTTADGKKTITSGILQSMLDGDAFPSAGPAAPAPSPSGMQTLEEAVRANGYGDKAPWPIPDNLGLGKSGVELMSAWALYLNRIGVQYQGNEETPRTGADERGEPGALYGLPAGAGVIRDSSGNITNYIAPKEPKEEPGAAAIVKGETVGGTPGTWFIRQPNGNLTPYTPPASPTSGMSFTEAANFIGERAERPDEFTRWMEALMAGPGGAPGGSHRGWWSHDPPHSVH